MGWDRNVTMDNPQQLAEAETYIIYVLENSNT